MLSLAAGGSSPIALWYLSRATGVVTLVLLTLTVALGVANFERFHSRRIPRFVVAGVHRNVALLAVAFVAIHVLTAVTDSYVSIGLVNVLLPFGAGYRPFWLGLGALSLDMTLAVIVTSLLRRRIGYRAWRATHWLAYASWPVAVAHSLGAGTDAGSGWMLLAVLACAAVVAVAISVRLVGRQRRRPAPSRRPAPASTG